MYVQYKGYVIKLIMQLINCTTNHDNYVVITKINRWPFAAPVIPQDTALLSALLEGLVSDRIKCCTGLHLENILKGQNQNFKF